MDGIDLHNTFKLVSLIDLQQSAAARMVATPIFPCTQWDKILSSISETHSTSRAESKGLLCVRESSDMGQGRRKVVMVGLLQMVMGGG
jgi:hypothetical protein